MQNFLYFFFKFSLTIIYLSLTSLFYSCLIKKLLIFLASTNSPFNLIKPTSIKLTSLFFVCFVENCFRRYFINYRRDSSDPESIAMVGSTALAKLSVVENDKVRHEIEQIREEHARKQQHDYSHVFR